MNLLWKTTTEEQLLHLQPVERNAKYYCYWCHVSEHVEEIKRVKRKLKYDIIQFDEKKRQIYNINQVKKREIAELEHELAKQNFEYKNKKAAIEQPIIDYRKTKFKLGEKHKLDLENVKYTYNIAKGKIKKLRINQVETLYKNELAIEKNKYKNKLIGLKESAALVKEDKEQRISDLRLNMLRIKSTSRLFSSFN